MSEALATIVVVPRESFSQARTCLESVFSCSAQVPFELVYVDGRSPGRTRRYLQARARERGFSLVRSRHYVAPNEARNIGFRLVRSRYVVFLDNNAVVTDGWLDALVRCAEETGAAFVSPIYCIGDLDEPIVHAAGGEGRVSTDGGGRHLVDVHRHVHRPLTEIHAELRREPCEFFEFHCVLIRSEVLAGLGGFDERLPAALEHIDFGMQATSEAGGGWFEPESIVTYLPPPPFAPSDLPYFLLRWSRAWVDTSFAHFARKWHLDLDEPGLQGNRRWVEQYRWAHLRRPRAVLRRALGRSFLEQTDRVVDLLVNNTVVRAASGARARVSQPPGALDARGGLDVTLDPRRR